jgi:hypothetical protein
VLTHGSSELGILRACVELYQRTVESTNGLVSVDSESTCGMISHGSVDIDCFRRSEA